MKHLFDFDINGSTISFDSVSSDNFMVAASLAEAAITDERVSLGLRSRAKSITTAITPDNDPSPITVSFSLDAGITFTYDPAQYEAHEPAVFSGKSISEFSLSDLYQASRTDGFDWKKALFPNAVHTGESEKFGMKLSFMTKNRTQFRCVSNPVQFQIFLMEWFKSGCPHHFTTDYWNYDENRVGEYGWIRNGKRFQYCKNYWLREFHILPPMMKSSSASVFPMSFDFVDENGFEVMRIDKLIMPNPYGQPMKLYLPLTNWGGDLLHPETGMLLKFPVSGKQPLFNLCDIQKASAVVICSSLDDAYGLNMSNAHQIEVAFTAFVYEPEHFGEVNIAPLEGKKLFMLISSQSGRSIAEEYLTVNSVCEHLRQKLGDKISTSFTFIHREVEYPDVGTANSFEAVYDKYKSCPPHVRKCELVSEADFLRRVSAITSFTNQTWMTVGQCTEENSLENDRSKQLLVRPLLHRGNITMCHGPSKVGKTTFALGLSALVISGKHGKVLIKGSAITVPSDAKPGKVIYLMFDPNCANNSVKLKDNIAKTYGLDVTEMENLIMLNMVGRGAAFMSDSHTIANEVLDAVEKRGTKDRPLSLIVIDTTTFIGQNESSVMRAIVSFASEFPKSAILCLSHENASGGASGDGRGNGKISGMCTHVFKLEKAECGVHFSFETSNDGILQFDSEGFTYKIADRYGKMEIIDPDRSEDDARALVKQQLMDAEYSAEECADQLGLAPSALRAAVQRSTGNN